MKLETKRLLLRNYKDTDLEDYWEFVSQANVGPRCGWGVYTDKQKAAERLKYEISKPLQFAIVLKEKNKVIGSIEIMDVNLGSEYDEIIKEHAKTKEIGALLNEKYWNCGYMSEALKTILRYCFENLDLDLVVASNFEPNIGSSKMQEKNGMLVYGRIKDFTIWYETDKPCDLILHKITKEEWSKMNI